MVPSKYSTCWKKEGGLESVTVCPQLPVGVNIQLSYSSLEEANVDNPQISQLPTCLISCSFKGSMLLDDLSPGDSPPLCPLRRSPWSLIAFFLPGSKERPAFNLSISGAELKAAVSRKTFILLWQLESELCFRMLGPFYFWVATASRPLKCTKLGNMGSFVWERILGAFSNGNVTLWHSDSTLYTFSITENLGS